MALYAEQLDELECPCGGCDHSKRVYITSRCHPANRDVAIYYSKDQKVLRLCCAVCDKHITEIAVAHRPVPKDEWS